MDIEIAIKNEPNGIHPLVYPSSSSREIYQYVMLPLADIDPITYEMTPILLEQLPNARKITSGKFTGMTSLDFTLLQEAAWDDGSTVTAYDVLFTIKSILLPTTDAHHLRPYIEDIEDIVIDSSDTKSFSIIIRDTELLTKEVIQTLTIYPAYHYDNDSVLSRYTLDDIRSFEGNPSMESPLDSFALIFNGNTFRRLSACGSGPYRVAEWIDKQRIRLEKKENYWGKGKKTFALKANPKAITFRIIKDDVAIASLLEDGTVDMTNTLPASQFGDIRERDSTSLAYYTPALTKFYFIAMNNSSDLLDDANVRRALAHLTDVDAIISKLESGLGTRSIGVIHPKKKYYNRNLLPITFDVSQAKNMLEKQGWKDTDDDGTIDKVIRGKHTEMVLDFFITGSAYSKSIALLLQEDYKKAGVGLRIITKPFKRIRDEHLKKKRYDMTVLALPQSMAADDPYGKWHSDNDTPTGGNDVAYHSARADSLIEAIQQDDDQRDRYYLELQEVMYTDQPVIFLYSPVERIVINKRWKPLVSSKRPGYFANAFEYNAP